MCVLFSAKLELQKAKKTFHCLSVSLPCVGNFGVKFTFGVSVRNDKQAPAKMLQIWPVINRIWEHHQPANLQPQAQLDRNQPHLMQQWLQEAQPRVMFPKLNMTYSNMDFLSDASRWDEEFTPAAYFQIWGCEWSGTRVVGKREER